MNSPGLGEGSPGRSLEKLPGIGISGSLRLSLPACVPAKGLAELNSELSDLNLALVWSLAGVE